MNSLVPSGRSRLLHVDASEIFFASKNLLAVLASKKLNNRSFLVSKPMTVVNITLVNWYIYSLKYSADFFFKVLLRYRCRYSSNLCGLLSFCRHSSAYSLASISWDLRYVEQKLKSYLELHQTFSCWKHVSSLLRQSRSTCFTANLLIMFWNFITF